MRQKTIVYNKDTLGDFLHKVLPLYFYLKSSGNTVIIENAGLNRAIDFFITKLNKTAFLATSDKLYIDGTYGKYRTTFNTALYSFNFRRELHQFFRTTFPPDATIHIFEDAPGILVHVGSLTKNRRHGNDNRLYQDRLAIVLRLFPERRFTVIGLAAEVVSTAFAQVLRSHPRIRNLLDATPLPVLIQLCYRAEWVIVRNTGILHLAGLCNAPIITLYANCSLMDHIALWSGWRPAVVRNDKQTPENKRLYYTEKWSPLSDQVVSVVEYRDAWYNASVAFTIAAELSPSHRKHNHLHNPGMPFMFLLFSIMLMFFIEQVKNGK